MFLQSSRQLVARGWIRQSSIHPVAPDNRNYVTIASKRDKQLSWRHVAKVVFNVRAHNSHLSLPFQHFVYISFTSLSQSVYFYCGNQSVLQFIVV